MEVKEEWFKFGAMCSWLKYSQVYQVIVLDNLSNFIYSSFGSKNDFLFNLVMYLLEALEGEN